MPLSRLRVATWKRPRFPHTDFRKEMRAIGQAAIEHVRRRTLSGRDASGRFFAPYAEGGKRGRVTLRDTGAMQGAVHVLSLTPHGVSIGISDGRQLSKALDHHHGTDRLPARPWFGTTRTHDERVVETITRGGAEAVNATGRLGD